MRRGQVMNQSESSSVAGIDETIGQVERLYRAVTGTDAPATDAAYAPIPAEKDPTQHVEEQLGRLIEMLGPTASPGPAAASWTPRVSVWEGEAEVLVCIDLPGLKREQVEVLVQGNTVTVSGSRGAARDGLRLRSCEHGLGAFRRTFFLPGGIRGSEPAAQMRDGGLEIRWQRPREAAAPRAVPIH